MPRRYESPVRAERAGENRDRLVCAAHGLFLRQGWTMTTMTQVAAAAGLARPTVYLHFDTKVDLLIACIDTSLSEIPVRDRVDYQAMGMGTAPQRAATAARWLRCLRAVRLHPAGPGRRCGQHPQGSPGTDSNGAALT